MTPSNGKFPERRMRRNRTDEWCRRLVGENKVTVDDLVYPLFVKEGKKSRELVESMPGVYRLSIDELLKEAKLAADLGINAIALFPVIEESKKSENAKESFSLNNLICRAVREIKKEIPDLGIICDVALDPYTSHGQDGIVKNGEILNAETVVILCKQALSLAEAGCDIVAPSDMMDGRIGAIRNALEKHQYSNVKILSYAVKYASSFYGPFRDAVGSAKQLGKADKRTYQMNCANSDEAIHEAFLDIQEGADMLMVKPGLPYLDVLSKVKSTTKMPIFVYQVSGEYSMIKAAAAKGWLDEEQILLETMLAFKRSGASAIFTYAAVDIAKILNQ